MLVFFIGIFLFIQGVISALQTFKFNMNIVDWMVTDLAPKLPPPAGNIIITVAAYLVIFFFKVLYENLEKLLKNT